MPRPLQSRSTGARWSCSAREPAGIPRARSTASTRRGLSRRRLAPSTGASPFLDARLATLGSLALEPTTHDLFLGEENGTRVYRLDADERLSLYVDGLRRLPGGSALAFDGAGRLVLLDHARSADLTGRGAPAAGLEQFRDEDYRGPLVFRLSLDPRSRFPPHRPDAAVVPAGVGRARRWRHAAPARRGGADRRRAGGRRLRSTLYRVAADSRLVPVVTLPSGQYLRINMLAAPDGGVFVSGGFSVGVIFRVSPDGAVTRLAGPLADPQGLALGPDGYLYVAESSLHRIVRFPVAGR